MHEVHITREQEQQIASCSWSQASYTVCIQIVLLLRSQTKFFSPSPSQSTSIRRPRSTGSREILRPGNRELEREFLLLLLVVIGCSYWSMSKPKRVAGFIVALTLQQLLLLLLLWLCFLAKLNSIYLAGSPNKPPAAHNERSAPILIRQRGINDDSCCGCSSFLFGLMFVVVVVVVWILFLVVVSNVLCVANTANSDYWTAIS